MGLRLQGTAVHRSRLRGDLHHDLPEVIAPEQPDEPRRCVFQPRYPVLAAMIRPARTQAPMSPRNSPACESTSRTMKPRIRSRLARTGLLLERTAPGESSAVAPGVTLRRACLNPETFPSLTKARVIIERRRRRCNEHRPHSQQRYITTRPTGFRSVQSGGALERLPNGSGSSASSRTSAWSGLA